MFIDETQFRVTAGNGGDGCVAFRREKYVPRGGPAGGDGGAGGSVILIADRGISTLLSLHHRKHIKAQSGRPGMGKQMTGKSGDDIVLRVPAGTTIIDLEFGETLGDLTEHGEQLVVARGGGGGAGNMHFATSTRQAPYFAKDGKPGQTRQIKLELKLLADIGIIGFPSVGKSTLISRISNAKPKIAAYPFTTLVPNLGLVNWRDFKSFVVADLPGLIEGAHEGKGLGHQFLRHLERVRVIVHMVEVPQPGSEHFDEARDPIEDYEVLRRELTAFNPELARRPEVVALNKVDLPSARSRIDELRQHFEARDRRFVALSAVTKTGVGELVDAMGQALVEVLEALEEEAAKTDLGPVVSPAPLTADTPVDPAPSADDTTAR